MRVSVLGPDAETMQRSGRGAAAGFALIEDREMIWLVEPRQHRVNRHFPTIRRVAGFGRMPDLRYGMCIRVNGANL